MELFTQAFGSLGGVVAWYRTAKVIQTLLLDLFGIVVFCYVDDFFFVIPESPAGTTDSAKFVLNMFQRIVTGLLGWDLDPEKEDYGDELLLLGVHIAMEDSSSMWRFNPTKAELWAREFEEVLASNHLPPSTASKFCGRMAFLNSTVCNRLGRALLRPLIWWQSDKLGQTCITHRLRCTIQWFIAVLRANVGMKIPFCKTLPRRRVVLYSDAEGNGGVAAVASPSHGCGIYMTSGP